MDNQHKAAVWLGAFICIGLTASAWLLGSSAIKFKEYERVVSVKGLSERELPADVAVWPIRFAAANNELTNLYSVMENNARDITDFLLTAGFSADEITAATPLVTDKLAERYGEQNVSMRYTAQQTITIYTTKIELVQQAQARIIELGKKGIAIGGDEYNQRVQYMFTKLNEVKPAMVEEATRNARMVAEQFAADSNSRLGKLKRANQGQFSVEDRDSNTPYLKKVRVVSTVDYYLID